VSNAADSSEAFYGAWSPDGAKLYYLTRSATGWTVRSANISGGGHSILIAFDDPTRQPTKYGFCTDGKKFYFTIGSPESDIFVAELPAPTPSPGPSPPARRPAGSYRILSSPPIPRSHRSRPSSPASRRRSAMPTASRRSSAAGA